jgi:sugar/nucleoside kinase (ribokinase family)
MKTKILSADIQIADRMVDISQASLNKLGEHECNKAKNAITLLDETIAAQGVSRGQKAKISKAQFEQFSVATGELSGKTLPGGSSANTLTTLSRLLNTKDNTHIETEMFGVVGSDMISNRIKGDLNETGITLLPETYPVGSPPPQAATSFVFQEEDGKRTIVTYPGNARDILKPDMITEELIAKNDVIFVQGSLWEKLDEDFPDKMLTLRYGNGDHPTTKAKELWLALPTHAQFRDNMPPARYRYLIPSADVVLSNDEELMRIYETKTLDDALKQLQEAISKRDQVLEHDHKDAHKKPPVAFVTCGKDGSAIVTPGRIERIAAPTLDANKPKFALGAGDTAYAGFLAGHIGGLKPEESANLGMQLACAKLAFDGARMPDPRTSLIDFSHVGQLLLDRVDSAIAEKQQVLLA